jgi:hypothetical protein
MSLLAPQLDACGHKYVADGDSRNVETRSKAEIGCSFQVQTHDFCPLGCVKDAPATLRTTLFLAALATASSSRGRRWWNSAGPSHPNILPTRYLISISVAAVLPLRQRAGYLRVRTNLEKQIWP